MDKTQYIMVDNTTLTRLIDEVTQLRDAVTTQTDNTPTTICYTNKDIANVLGVSDKLVKKYRDEGVLPFSMYGDKYWYTPKDVDVFLQNTHKEAFNSPNC